MLLCFLSRFRQRVLHDRQCHRLSVRSFFPLQMHSSLGRSCRGSPVSSRPPSQGSSPSRPSSPEPQAPDEPDSSRQWALIVAAVAGLVYLTTLPGDMVYDDIVAVKENRDVRSYTPLVNVFKNDFWGTPIHKVCRQTGRRPPDRRVSQVWWNNSSLRPTFEKRLFLLRFIEFKKRLCILDQWNLFFSTVRGSILLALVRVV